jgi:hypothetical protein
MEKMTLNQFFYFECKPFSNTLNYKYYFIKLETD